MLARLTDESTFAVAIAFETAAELQNACRRALLEICPNPFEQKRWLNAELHQIDEWLERKCNERPRSETELRSLESQAGKYRHDRYQGKKYGKREIHLFGISVPVFLHVFDRHCGLLIDKMINKSEAFIPPYRYSESIGEFCHDGSTSSGNILKPGNIHTKGRRCSWEFPNMCPMAVPPLVQPTRFRSGGNYLISALTQTNMLRR